MGDFVVRPKKLEPEDIDLVILLEGIRLSTVNDLIVNNLPSDLDHTDFGRDLAALQAEYQDRIASAHGSQEDYLQYQAAYLDIGLEAAQKASPIIHANWDKISAYAEAQGLNGTLPDCYYKTERTASFNMVFGPADIQEQRFTFGQYIMESGLDPVEFLKAAGLDEADVERYSEIMAERDQNWATLKQDRAPAELVGLSDAFRRDVAGLAERHGLDATQLDTSDISLSVRLDLDDLVPYLDKSFLYTNALMDDQGHPFYEGVDASAAEGQKAEAPSFDWKSGIQSAWDKPIQNLSPQTDPESAISPRMS